MGESNVTTPTLENEFTEPVCENIDYTNENTDIEKEEDEELDQIENILFDVQENIAEDPSPCENTITDEGDCDFESYPDYANEDYEENNNELDEEAINSFITQLFELKRNNLKKKREGKVIPSVKKYLKLDFEGKGENLTPFVTKNLLHICELILSDKIHVDVSHSDRGVIEHIVDKDTPMKDIKFTLVEDFRIHSYIRKAVKQLEEIQQQEQRQINGRKK